jgi:hypothetical protein
MTLTIDGHALLPASTSHVTSMTTRAGGSSAGQTVTLAVTDGHGLHEHVGIPPIGGARDVLLEAMLCMRTLGRVDGRLVSAGQSLGRF